MPLSHMSIATGARHFNRMRSFYLSSLAPLGYVIYYDRPNSMLGLQPAGKFPDFWLHAGNGEQAAFPAGGDVDARPGRTHVCFDVDTQELVDRWYDEAIKAGGTCNGKPGLRSEFAEPYYAAFVLDPLGNNIEAVHYRPTKRW
ncbi:putative lactoylglutathione lyase protein [Rosellinia necatrix]|uniref:Putative lactoylglutathione lyase protein n=1 Tax=Rosellinia necatrix TaxID=77044 RepID=A0A1W2TI39_ROSNE|nr:putative lactoylglutathione lyase protein [Rosellinia necatrix]